MTSNLLDVQRFGYEPPRFRKKPLVGKACPNLASRRSETQQIASRQGETPHFDFISKATTDALMYLSVSYKKPIGNGVITCLNKKQTLKRGSKGSEAAIAVISVLMQK